MLIDGSMPAVEQADLTQHLDGCPRCQQAIERLSASGPSWADVARRLREGPPAGDEEPELQRAVDRLTGQATAESSDGAEKLDFLQPPAKPGQLGRLGHYEVLEVVGQGGMGTVLRAFDEKLHRVVAIKVMAGELAASGTARRRFVREAQAAAAVAHEHVVTIHAVEEEHRPPFLVMQYVDGTSLQDKLDRVGPLGLKEILRIGLQIAHGLAAAHKQGLVHRDIKPANILLENGVERVKITDFGLARAVDDASLTQSGVIAGTPMYMSPEQAAGEPIDHRSLWSGVDGSPVLPMGRSDTQAAVTSLAFLGDSRHLLSAHSDGQLLLHAVQGAESLLGRWTGHNGSANAVAVVSDNVAISVGDDGFLRFWTVSPDP